LHPWILKVIALLQHVRSLQRRQIMHTPLLEIVFTQSLTYLAGAVLHQAIHRLQESFPLLWSIVRSSGLSTWHGRVSLELLYDGVGSGLALLDGCH
jgi:hypothetical protein